MSKTANYKKVIEVLRSGNYDAENLLTEIAKNNPGRFLKAYYDLYERNDEFSSIRALLKSEKKIMAIKEYRQMTGKDLYKSKEAVDKIEAEMRLSGELLKPILPSCGGGTLYKSVKEV